jgi:60 kDa SS-A/Ro ribonucleoprotein
MMTTNSLRGVSFGHAAHQRTTPVNVRATTEQVMNNQGGYVFEIDDMERARRFLILGSEDSFYAAGQKLAFENATTIRKIAKSDRAIELIDLITDVSVSGRAPSQSPGLFALALVIAETEDEKTKHYGFSKLSEVARTAATLFEFVGYFSQFKNLGGSGFKKAIGRWFMEKPLETLGYQMAKYRQRGGYDYARLLRLSKYVKSNDRPELRPLLDWSLGKDVPATELPRAPKGFEIAKNTSARELPHVIERYRLSWEMLPTEALNDVKVWEALLDYDLVPMGALIRQLPRLTNLGIIAPLGGRISEIENILTNRAALKRARIHPVKALIAMRTYQQGYNEHGNTWRPVGRVVGALEDAFYGSFDAVEPTNKNIYYAIDVSQSMTSPRISKDVPLTPREASAVMAMVGARTEKNHYFGAFQDRIEPLNITARDSLQSVIQEVSKFPFRGTNLSLPFLDAAEQGMEVDAFSIYTDNETGLGHIHPFQALSRYRRISGIQSKVIINAMTPTQFSIADPKDPNSLDVSGFDTAVPQLVADFISR